MRNCFQDIDHVGYVRQAFQAASLNYIQEVLQNDILRESEVSYFSNKMSLKFSLLSSILVKSSYFLFKCIGLLSLF